MTGGGEVRLNGRRGLIAAGIAGALTVAAVALLGQLTGYGTLLRGVERARKEWLGLCIAGEILAYGGYVVAYRAVAAADGGPILRLRNAAQVIALGLGAYVLGSSAGGLAVDYWALRRAGSTPRRAARRTLALNTLQAAALTALALVAAVVVLAEGVSRPLVFVAIAWAAGVPAVTAAAVVVSAPSRARKLLARPAGSGRPRVGEWARWPRWLFLQLRRGFAAAIGGLVLVRHVLSHPRRYGAGIVGYPVFWLGDFLILWAALAAFGIRLDPARLVVAEATAWILSFLPLPGGGSGLAEASMAGALHLAGVPLAAAVPAAVLYRGVNFWLPLLPALALVPRVRRLADDLGDADRADTDRDAPLHVVGRRSPS